MTLYSSFLVLSPCNSATLLNTAAWCQRYLYWLSQNERECRLRHCWMCKDPLHRYFVWAVRGCGVWYTPQRWWSWPEWGEEYCLVGKLIEGRQLYSWLVEVDSVVGGIIVHLLIFGPIVDEDSPHIWFLLTAFPILFPCVIGRLLRGLFDLRLSTYKIIQIRGLVIRIRIIILLFIFFIHSL